MRDKLFFVLVGPRKGRYWQRLTLSPESSDISGRVKGMILPAREAAEHRRLRREIARAWLAGASSGEVSVYGSAYTVGTNAGDRSSGTVRWKWAESICDEP